MAHARKFDLLLTRIKQERLDKQIAFVEIHNELSAVAQFFGGPEATKRHTEYALGYLQAGHPDLLFSGDYVGPWSGDFSFDYKALHAAASAYAKNTQLVDHHMYAFGVQAEFFRQAGLWTALRNFSSADFDTDGYMARIEKENELFKRMLLPGSPSWREYRHHFKVETPWRPIVYLFENMDNDAYDYWMFRHFHEHEDRMMGYWKNTAQFMGQRGRDTDLPVVCDEGYVFYAPLNSEFEARSAVGRRWHEFIVDRMLEQDCWGIYLPHTFWYTTTDWLRELNHRVMA